jgi:hypothetical protein
MMPGAVMEDNAVLGAAIGYGVLKSGGIYVGNPARLARTRRSGAQSAVMP